MSGEKELEGNSKRERSAYRRLKQVVARVDRKKWETTDDISPDRLSDPRSTLEECSCLLTRLEQSEGGKRREQA